MMSFLVAGCGLWTLWTTVPGFNVVPLRVGLSALTQNQLGSVQLISEPRQTL